MSTPQHSLPHPDDDEISTEVALVPQEPVKLTDEESQLSLAARLKAPDIEYKCADCDVSVWLTAPYDDAKGNPVRANWFCTICGFRVLNNVKTKRYVFVLERGRREGG